MRYPRNSPNIVSGGGGFHDMYIELDDVLWAIVVTGLPIGTTKTVKQFNFDFIYRLRAFTDLYVSYLIKPCTIIEYIYLQFLFFL